MRTFVMGDIHGAYRALQQCLERSGFDKANDVLIQLGDVTDGYPEVYECVEALLEIKHLVAIKGNHDDWFSTFIKTDFHPYHWNYGGKGTLHSYLEHAGKSGRFFAVRSGYKTALGSEDVPVAHRNFFDAGHSGRLTILDVNTKNYWQSDPLPELYSENYRQELVV